MTKKLVFSWVAILSGVAASMVANVWAADPNLQSRIVAVWPSFALLIVVELFDSGTGWLYWVRTTATAVITLIVATVSYSHIYEVVLEAGENEVAAALLPLSIDGLFIVGLARLVEIRRDRAAERAAEAAEGHGVSDGGVELADTGNGVTGPFAEVSEVDDFVARVVAAEEDSKADAVIVPVKSPEIEGQLVLDEVATVAKRPSKEDTAVAVRTLAARYPSWTQKQLAEKLGVSARTVRRYI